MLWPETTTRSAAGELCLGGIPATRLAAEFGTPLYVFDELTLRTRARRIVRAFRERHDRSRVVYGGKAYLSPAIVRIFQEYGIGLDVVSGGEIWGGLKAGIDPREMVFHGNNKTEAELSFAVEQGIGTIVVDNNDEVGLLNSVAGGVYGRAGRVGTKVPVTLRLNPGVDVHTHAKISTGIVDSKFGIPVWGESVADTTGRIVVSEHLELAGFHMHLGSQVLDNDSMPTAIDRQVEVAALTRERFGVAVDHYSPGGGLGIAYTEEGVDPEPEAWAEVIVPAYRAAWEKHDMPAGSITVEPGRWLVGPAAVALYRVGSVKEIPGVRTYIAVDGGMADNSRPAMYDARYTAEIANRRGDGAKVDVRIAGRFCESGDVLIQSVALPRVEVGDLVAVPASGAYQLPMASNYNAVPRPAVVMVRDGAARVIRRRETIEDVFACEVFDT
jgi:diaminopimelate decarboxylase